MAKCEKNAGLDIMVYIVFYFIYWWIQKGLYIYQCTWKSQYTWPVVVCLLVPWHDYFMTVLFSHLIPLGTRPVQRMKSSLLVKWTLWILISLGKMIIYLMGMLILWLFPLLSICLLFPNTVICKRCTDPIPFHLINVFLIKSWIVVFCNI